MNKKDYKAIAEIMKKRKKNFKTFSTWMVVINDLIDYFEKEEHESRRGFDKCGEFIFDKKSFLLDCEVLTDKEYKYILWSAGVSRWE